MMLKKGGVIMNKKLKSHERTASVVKKTSKMSRSQSSREINQQINQEIRKNGVVKVKSHGQDSIAVGVDKKAKITVDGSAGDFFGALVNGASLTLNGNAGRFAGDVMRNGKITINGNCGEGTGMYMYGGQIAVNGDGGDNIGQISKGGAILITGNAGDFVGLYLTGGDIVVLKNIGKKTGDWMIKGRIFVGGKIANLGNNTTIQQLNNDDRKFLNTLFAQNNIKNSLKNIKKIVPKELRPFY